ncbi:MAG: Do family serine endopeptidase [Ekhidna sp.]
MNKKSLILTVIFASIFGGVVAIFGYSLIQPQPNIQYNQATNRNPVALTNYVFDSSDFVVPEGLNFVFAAKNATPSVVHIRTLYKEGAGSTQYNDFFKEYFGDRYQRRGGPARGAGSGVIISPNGYIVTNNHVIENADEIEIVLNDNRSYEADVIGVDENTDLAVIKINADNLPAVNYGNSEAINVGEWVLAIGNPFEFRSTVTAGIVSAKGRNINILRGDYRIESFIQTDAAVNPGNSGGALVNLKGELVGINTAIASPSGAFAGYSFAVPVSLVQKVVDDLVEFGTVQRALLGISIVDVNAQNAEEYDLDLLKGIYIRSVNPNGAAYEAGIEQGDVITAINGKAVNNVAQLQEQIAINRPGDDVLVSYVREGTEREVKATLRNAEGTIDIVELKNDFISQGATFIDVSDELKNSLNLEGGVQVASIEDGKWKEAGLKEGFIITEISDRNIDNTEDLENYLSNPKGDGILIEGVYPNGDKAYYGLGL